MGLRQRWLIRCLSEILFHIEPLAAEPKMGGHEGFYRLCQGMADDPRTFFQSKLGLEISCLFNGVSSLVQFGPLPKEMINTLVKVTMKSLFMENKDRLHPEEELLVLSVVLALVTLIPEELGASEHGDVAYLLCLKAAHAILAHGKASLCVPVNSLSSQVPIPLEAVPHGATSPASGCCVLFFSGCGETRILPRKRFRMEVDLFCSGHGETHIFRMEVYTEMFSSYCSRQVYH